MKNLPGKGLHSQGAVMLGAGQRMAWNEFKTWKGEDLVRTHRPCKV